jgi:type II secretory pathway component PulK
MNKLPKKLKDQKGVALLIVMSFLLFVTFMVLDFDEQVLINSQAAYNFRDRLQAHYLAKSGENFSRMVILYQKKIDAEVAKQNTTNQMIQEFGSVSLYEMLPISTEFLRGIASAAGLNLPGVGADEEGDVELDEEVTSSESGGFVSSGAQGAAEEFLDFPGDFEAIISEENGKFSLNTFSKLQPDSDAYDLHKKVLYSILMDERFKMFFENQERDAADLSHAIGDFIDLNDSINLFDKVERGRESSLYSQDDYDVKNAKLLSFSELRLVKGMSDDILEAIKDRVTIYHTDSTINPCRSPPELLDSLIVHYTANAECTRPIDPDDQEYIDELREEVLLYCPKKVDMARALNVALGIIEAGSTTNTTNNRNRNNNSTSKVGGCKIQFEDLLSESNEIFKIESVGRVGNVIRRSTTVLDARSDKVASWKVLYYSVK